MPSSSRRTVASPKKEARSAVGLERNVSPVEVACGFLGASRFLSQIAGRVGDVVLGSYEFLVVME